MKTAPSTTQAGDRRARWRTRTRVLSALGGLGLCSPWMARAWPEDWPRGAWLLDLAAHWQWLYLAGLGMALGIALAAHRRWLAAAVLFPLPWLAASPALPVQPDGETATASFTLASANVHVSTTRADRLASWLAQASPDAVVLLEVSPQLARELPGLKPDYPHQLVQADDSPFGIALLSRHPLAASSKVAVDNPDGIPHIDAELELPTAAPGPVAGAPPPRRRVKLLAFHPMPPLSPHFHAARDASLHALARRSQAQGQPSLLAGDLNATPWSSAFRGLDESGWRRATGLRASWPAWGGGVFGIPIDHVLASAHWRLQSREIGPDLGSDHRPVLVRLALRPADTPPAAP